VDWNLFANQNPTDSGGVAISESIVDNEYILTLNRHDDLTGESTSDNGVEVTLPGLWTVGTGVGQVQLVSMSSGVSLSDDFVYDSTTNTTELIGTAGSIPNLKYELVLHGALVPEPAPFVTLAIGGLGITRDDSILRLRWSPLGRMPFSPIPRLKLGRNQNRVDIT
jgi:hypothetical protein